MKYYVERMEEEFAVLIEQNEGAHSRRVPIAWLPEDIAEGDYVEKIDGEFVAAPSEHAAQLFSVDRIEGDYAVLEDLNDDELLSHPVPLAWLPEDVAEGDILRKSDEGYALDEDETARRKAQLHALLGGILDA